MAKITIKINGLNEFQKALKEYPKISTPLIKNALIESAIEWQGRSGAVTPVGDTGNLRQAVVSFSALTIEKTRVILTPDIKYAIYVHEGTRFMSKRPFLEWGLNQAKNKIERIFQKAVDKLLNKLAK